MLPVWRGFFIDDLLAATDEAGRVYADKHLVVTRTENPAGLRFAGEIDITNSVAVAQAVRLALSGIGDPHLDLTRLGFTDVSGIRALVDLALGLDGGRRMLLHGLPAQLQTVMRVTGWSGRHSLVLCTCSGAVE